MNIINNSNSRRHSIQCIFGRLLEEFPKEAEDAKKADQKRRGTLAQILLGERQTGKNSPTETSPSDKRQPRSVSRRSRVPESTEIMKPKIMHVMVVGPKDCGKTTFLRTLAYGKIPPSTSLGNTSPIITPTIEQKKNYSPTREDDTYHIQVYQPINPSNIQDVNKQSPIELILFHDTIGIPPFGNIELKKAHLQVADAFLLFYSVTDPDSFNRVDAIKKQLEREKFGISGREKRGGTTQIVVVGTKCDLIGRRRVERQFALNWATQEKGEPKFSLSRKLRPEKSNAQIVMDF
ncbi:hypothetical protein Mgra_00004411 [Meloidogyne graminicola]|uniref:Uncharacterized protein n=1 Tax=Meloidogyne graminicola TaxID=189291 RepID=A0A8S9ZRX6_9BILA|nr:hypothetical protein Mgra_00004411 [Meloidogyne graminicola]